MHNKNPSIINEANKIVTNRLITTFLDEVDYYMDICGIGNHHIVTRQKQIVCVLDATFDDTAEAFIDKFCYLFTDKTEILVNIECIDDDVEVPYLKMTLQSGAKYYVQDFSENYFQI